MVVRFSFALFILIFVILKKIDAIKFAKYMSKIMLMRIVSLFFAELFQILSYSIFSNILCSMLMPIIQDKKINS